mmetsp:Transcript_17500/g.35742  ORF Transcript_17500/g.35742 Transcript_17500/m.35742 type:complete len:121 (-) Transcript_17500:324-686(-)
MMRGSTLLIALTLACLATAVSATAGTRSLQQFSNANGFQNVDTIYWRDSPFGPLSIAVGNVPNFFLDGFLSGLFDEYGETWGIEDALDYGLDGIIEQSLGNALRIGQDAATGGASTITVG